MVKPLTSGTNFIRLSVPSEQKETFARFRVNRMSDRSFRPVENSFGTVSSTSFVTVIFLIIPKARRSSYTMAFRIKVIAEAEAVENSSEIA